VKPHLLLGRRGDITSLLPILQYRAELDGQPQELVVSRDYASFLDGVSYVRPIVYPGPFDTPTHASHWLGRQAINCTVYGRDIQRRRECWTFDREIWRHAGMEQPFGTLPLEFDRRDRQREKELRDNMPRGKPVVLLSLSGISAPFPEPQRFKDKLVAALPEFHVLDVSNIPLHRPYDMLAWMDEAVCLITSDSLPLHLSRVSELPTICLLNDQYGGWEASAWRPHHRLRVPMSEAFTRFGEFREAVVDAYCDPLGRLVTFQTPTANVDTHRRLELARASRYGELSRHPQFWLKELQITEPLSRDARELGETIPLPYVRDLIEQAFAQGEEFAAIANADIGFTPGLTGLMIDELRRSGACWAHRWDFTRVNRLATSEAQVRRARWYPGCDFFAFTRVWWEARREMFPDMVLGREAWDLVMRHLMRRSGCREIHQAIYHERHESPWEVIRDLPGNVHNRRLAQEWMDKYGGNWRDWEVEPIYK
jgi:hypothetical protein